MTLHGNFWIKKVKNRYPRLPGLLHSLGPWTSWAHGSSIPLDFLDCPGPLSPLEIPGPWATGPPGPLDFKSPLGLLDPLSHLHTCEHFNMQLTQEFPFPSLAQYLSFFGVFV